MKINQLSLFLENKPGRLGSPLKLLAKAGINILTLTLADTQQYGILRLITKDWAKAQTVLQQAGHVVNVTEVVAVELEDRPGSLANILDCLETSGVNIEYIYALTFRRDSRVACIFRFDQPDAAIKALAAGKFHILDGEALW